MNTGPVTFGLLFMASRAVRGFGRQIIVRVFERNVDVAADAGIGPMDGGGELGFVDIEPKGFACGVSFVESFVRVTVQAGAVLNLRTKSADDEGHERAQGSAQASETVTHAAEASACVINFALPALLIFSLFLFNSDGQKNAKNFRCSPGCLPKSQAGTQLPGLEGYCRRSMLLALENGAPRLVRAFARASSPFGFPILFGIQP